MPFVMFPEVRLLFSAKAITVLFLLELYRNGYPLALYKNGGFCQYAGGEKPCVISETENPKNDDAQTAELVYDRKKRMTIDRRSGPVKIIRGLKLGGLQHKIFNLMLIIIIFLVGVFVLVNVYQQRNLSGIVEEASREQQASITQVSEATMEAVLSTTMTKTAALQAYIAGDLFADVKTSVLTLQSFASELFAHEEVFSPHPIYPPDRAKDGVPTVQFQTEEGVDPYGSEALSLVANMSEIMLGMYRHSDKLSSCFVATADGTILYVDDRSGSYFDENGEVYHFPVRSRPWYQSAAETGELIFTGVELDTYTDIAGLVCAAPVFRDGELVAVVGADIFLTSIRDYVENANIENGFLCVVNENGQVLFSPQREGVFKPELTETAPDLRKSGNEALAGFISAALTGSTGLQTVAVDGKDYYLTGTPMPTVGWAVVSAVEKGTTRQPTVAMLQNYDAINANALAVFRRSTENSARTFLILTALIILLGVGAALAVANRIVRPLEHMTKRINSLSDSDSIFEMEKVYRTGDEIEVLAESFASISQKTRDYIRQITEITAEKERIGTELALATRIQADMLPNIYPAFPDRKEFDIYATMDPAKEVGGDFYDFFLVDDDHLCMIMADVSGKGVPAALFMMASKIILANNAMLGKSPAQILTDTNAAICANNREEMFVTVWLGILELSTGKLTAANAGHEYPVLRKPDGSYELFKDKHGFVIGGMKGVKYREYELQLEPGGKLFVYTDGVPEATNAENELFGTERMMQALNEDTAAAPETVLKNVRRAVDAFVKEAEQFDDLTMLCMEYRGKQHE
jgi:sigma-B regulation protein RsbU (phosphoserine phosphatase)